LEEDKILFSASSATSEERQSGEDISFYFDHYDDVDPRVFDIFKARKKSFLEYTDQWGTFRSIYLPTYSTDGTFYLSVADLSISHIKALLNEQIYNSIFIAILFLVFAYPLYYSATIRLKQNAKRIDEEAHRQALAFKGHQEKLVENQRVLFTLAKERFVDQKSALTAIITAAAKQLELARVSVWLFNKDKTAILCQAMYNQGEIDLSQSSLESKGHPNYFKTISSIGFISADNAHTHSATKEFLENYLLPNDISSMLDAPIYIQGEIIGITCFENIGPQRQWSREDEDFARSLSDLCAQVFLNEQRKKAEKRLLQQAHYDALTQLPNRVLFADRFSQAVAQSKRTQSLFAICFLDLDNFKPVNDTYGHETGDQLLIEVAKRIKETMREQDTVSRQGGDEFTLLLGDIESAGQCEQILMRINAALGQPYFIIDSPRNISLSISVSIGATLYPNDNADLDTLIRHADQAMYQAKLAGKNQLHFFNAANDQQTINKQIKLQEIKLALTNNEFHLYYQP
jgi:diguanylate cyclase (GGDEF)-like protein